MRLFRLVRLRLMIMNAVSRAYRHYLVHIRRATFCELVCALRKKLFEPAGHRLDEHMERLAVGVAKGMDGAARHKHSGSGRDSDPVLIFQELSRARQRPEPLILVFVMMRWGAAPRRGDIRPHAELASRILNAQVKNHLIAKGADDSGILWHPNRRLGFHNLNLGQLSLYWLLAERPAPASSDRRPV